MSWMKDLLNEARLAKTVAEQPARQALPMPGAIFDFEDVADAIRVVEDGIRKRAELARETGKERILEVAQDLSSSFLETRPFSAMASDLWQTDVVLPVILRRSLLVTVCSHAEFVLKQWCAGLHDHWELARAPKKPSNEAAPHYYVRYLAEEAELQVNDFETWTEWDTFDAYWAARNAIVHNAGSIDAQSEKAERIRKVRFIQIDESGLLLPDPGVVHVLPGGCEEAAWLAASLFERIGRAYLLASEQRGVQS